MPIHLDARIPIPAEPCPVPTQPGAFHPLHCLSIALLSPRRASQIKKQPALLQRNSYYPHQSVRRRWYQRHPSASLRWRFPGTSHRYRLKEPTTRYDLGATGGYVYLRLRLRLCLSDPASAVLLLSEAPPEPRPVSSPTTRPHNYSTYPKTPAFLFQAQIWFNT